MKTKMEEELYNYRGEVTRVVDGDTLDLTLDLGFGVFKEVRIRLSNVDTPEIYGVKKGSEEYERGKEASAFVEEWLNPRDYRVVVRTEKGEPTGKYGRWLGYIYDPKSGKCLNDRLAAKGWADD